MSDNPRARCEKCDRPHAMIDDHCSGHLHDPKDRHLCQARLRRIGPASDMWRSECVGNSVDWRKRALTAETQLGELRLAVQRDADIWRRIEEIAKQIARNSESKI